MAAEVISSNPFAALAEDGAEEEVAPAVVAEIAPAKTVRKEEPRKVTHRKPGTGARPPKREYDRHSAGKPFASERTEHRQGHGRFNWGSNTDQGAAEDQVPATDKDKEGAAATAAAPTENAETDAPAPPVEEEEKQMSLDEYYAAQAAAPKIALNIRQVSEEEVAKEFKDTVVIDRTEEEETHEMFFKGTGGKTKKAVKARKERNLLVTMSAPSYQAEEFGRPSRGRGGGDRDGGRGRGGPRGGRGGPRGGRGGPRGGMGMRGAPRGRGGFRGAPRGGAGAGAGPAAGRGGFNAADQSAFPSLGSQ